MKKKMLKLMSLLLTLCIVLPFAACGNQKGQQGGEPQSPSVAVDAGALFETLRTSVTYESGLQDVSKGAKYTYAGLPEGTKIVMYSAVDGHFADELSWIALADAADADAAMDIVEEHIASKREQFVSYEPGEVSKIDSYQVWSDSKNIVLCITADSKAKAILDDPTAYVKDIAVTEPDATQAPTQTEPEISTQPPETEPPASENYPAVTAQNTAMQKYNTYLAVDNTGYEYYNYSESDAANYAQLISTVADSLQGEANVYCMVIPTAIGVTFPDNVEYSGKEDQAARLQQIYSKMSSNVIPVNLHHKLMQHRDEYLYFRTDWHWTGVGAYYGYERFCEIKGFTPYTLDQRQEHVSDGYIGLFSSGTTADTIYAYDPYYKDDVTFVYTDSNGFSGECPIIRDDVSAYWYVFAAGDQPYAEITNAAVTDGSVAIVVKESFGCALMSYICDHYSTVYEIDYRYWRGDLVEFAREVGADDILFANNIGMVRSSQLIGNLANIVP